jgi:hypothetical protein
MAGSEDSSLGMFLRRARRFLQRRWGTRQYVVVLKSLAGLSPEADRASGPWAFVMSAYGTMTAPTLFLNRARLDMRAPQAPSPHGPAPADWRCFEPPDQSF